MAVPSRNLRVLLADGRTKNLDDIAEVIERLGHVVVAKETSIASAAARTDTEPVDVAIVVVGEGGDHALELIGSIVHEAACPVIAVLDVEDPVFVLLAARRGVFAYIAGEDTTDDMFESAIDVVLHRFAEYHDLQGAFGRRAVTERAKGILMERHGIDEEAAFHMLRDQSRSQRCKLIDIAQAVLDARDLLPNTPPREPGDE